MSHLFLIFGSFYLVITNIGVILRHNLKTKDMEKYYCDEHNHIGQVHVKDSEKELERINNQTYTKGEFKIIQCDVFIETSMFDNDKEIETSENHVWIVKK